MTWWRERALQLTGVLCLLGQGTLLYFGSAGRRVPGLAWPGAFLLLTLVLAVVLALALRRERSRANRHATAGAGLLLLAVGGLLAACLGILSVGGEAPAGGRPGPPARSVAEVRQELSGLPGATEALIGRLRDMSTAQEEDGRPGRLFRLLAGAPDLWLQHFPSGTTYPAQMIIWRQGQPVAWSPAARPLTGPLPLVAGVQTVRFFQENGGLWYVRTVAELEPGLVLEVQTPLASKAGDPLTSTVRLQVVRLDQAPVVVDDRGNAVASVALTDSRDRLAVVPVLTPEDRIVRRESRQARFMILAGVSWLTALAGAGRLFFGWQGFLAALWLGRGVLAAVDFFRWTGPAYPGMADPAAPGHLISLVGPAYFATPFAWGWLASTADALLTAAVVGLTVWGLLGRLELLGRADPASSAPAFRRFQLGQGPASGLLFGAGGGGVLLALRFFAALVTENANPRLIGQGVSLTFLSFWGLHLVLAVVSFGLVALLAGLAAGRPWPARRELGGWLAGAVVAALAAAGICWPATSTWWGLPPLAGGLVAGIWLAAPALVSRPRFLRRFAWPALMLMAVVWNYVALREVYDQAERNWLERKGQVITGSGEDWSRFLLEDALLGMRDQDALMGPAGSPAGIWRDRPAFDLWRGSALGDLGYSCLVEIIGPDEMEESLFATGFMRDFQYEVIGRSAWAGKDGQPADQDWDLIFQTERRIYPGGEEEILAAETVRRDGRGWIRVELPTRSWRISTLLADLTGGLAPAGGYQPRSEVDRPVLLLRGDATGWLGTGDPGFSGGSSNRLVEELKSGQRQWAVLQQGETRWLCRWNALPEGAARTPGEGFLLGLRQSAPGENLLDLSRLMLLNLVLLFLLFLGVQFWYRLTGRLPGAGGDDEARPRWMPGFQEKFLAGYLALGLLLLLVVGASVDRVGYDRVRAEARSQTRDGLATAMAQLRGLLVEQARSLAASEYIADLLVGQLEGQRPVGPLSLQQGMVFAGDGSLLLDETLSNLSDAEADALLQAGRSNPLLVIRDDGDIFVATVIPIELDQVLATAPLDSLDSEPGHGTGGNWGSFLYRQRLDQSLLRSLADLVQGQATLRLDGQPLLASHPGPVFSGQAALLAGPAMMASLLDHPGGPGVFAQQGRPFAFTGGQPLPSFGRNDEGKLTSRPLPAVLEVAFPDREREYAAQRRGTGLFLAGLANLILLTALLLAMLMSWNLFRPLRVLLTATRRLARGDFDAPLPDAGSDEVGRLAGAFGLMRRELHGARESLAAREQFLTTVLDQVSVGVAVLTVEGEVVALNPAGRHILADYHPDRPDEEGARALLADFQELGGGNPRWGGELRSADGQHTLRGALAPLQLPDGRNDTLLVFEDITEFLRTKKMAINAELARQVAHEVKNPLTPIQLSVQLLSQAWRDKHPELDRIVGDTVERVLEQVSLLRTIASEFSLLGRPGELELGPVDLVQATRQVVDAYHNQWQSQQDGMLVTVAEQEVPPVLADEDSLQKILGNLMQNSLDAARTDEPLQVEVSWQVGPREVTLVWQDNGLGLDAEVADRLFDPYFSTKSKGTGLGLAICRNLADRMGGNINLSNRPAGPGARATLTLPRSS
jgi:signal transduction histidine kinase/HAMP domain-containing protein